MNPIETFALLLKAITDGDGHEAELAAGHLADWIKSGGKMPQTIASARVEAVNLAHAAAAAEMSLPALMTGRPDVYDVNTTPILCPSDLCDGVLRRAEGDHWWHCPEFTCTFRGPPGDISGTKVRSVVEAIARVQVLEKEVKRIPVLEKAVKALRRALSRWQNGRLIESDYVREDGSIAINPYRHAPKVEHEREIEKELRKKLTAAEVKIEQQRNRPKSLKKADRVIEKLRQTISKLHGTTTYRKDGETYDTLRRERDEAVKGYNEAVGTLAERDKQITLLKQIGKTTISTICYELGGMVERHPTSSIDYLQRVRELRRIEKDLERALTRLAVNEEQIVRLEGFKKRVTDRLTLETPLQEKVQDCPIWYGKCRCDPLDDANAIIAKRDKRIMELLSGLSTMKEVNQWAGEWSRKTFALRWMWSVYAVEQLLRGETVLGPRAWVTAGLIPQGWPAVEDEKSALQAEEKLAAANELIEQLKGRDVELPKIFRDKSGAQLVIEDGGDIHWNGDASMRTTPAVNQIIAAAFQNAQVKSGSE